MDIEEYKIPHIKSVSLIDKVSVVCKRLDWFIKNQPCNEQK